MTIAATTANTAAAAATAVITRRAARGVRAGCTNASVGTGTGRQLPATPGIAAACGGTPAGSATPLTPDGPNGITAPPAGSFGAGRTGSGGICWGGRGTARIGPA